MTEPSPVTLYSSWRGLLYGIVTPALLIGFSVISMVVAGRVAILAAVVLMVGLVLAAVTLADMPRRSLLDAAGIRRRCLIRTQHIEWGDVSAIIRAPGPFLSLARSRPQGRLGRAPGGLTAVVGRRKYLLVDVAESADEFDEIQAALRAWSPDLALMAPRPFERTPPTWLYHERGRR